MAHGSPEGISIDGIGFDLDPECAIGRLPEFKVEKKATTGKNTSKNIKQVPQIKGIKVQFKDEKSKDLLYSLVSTDDIEIIITFAGKQKLYIDGTFNIEDSDSQEGSVDIIIEPSIPPVFG
jgi:hypothetical protein